MRAIVYKRTGDESVLEEVVDRPVPEPGPVRCWSGWRSPGSTRPTGRPGAGRWPDGWQIPGQDGAGVIEAVGAGVDATGRRTGLALGGRLAASLGYRRGVHGRAVAAGRTARLAPFELGPSWASRS